LAAALPKLLEIAFAWERPSFPEKCPGGAFTPRNLFFSHFPLVGE